MMMSAIARLIIYKLFIVLSFGFDTNDFIMIKLPITVNKLFMAFKNLRFYSGCHDCNGLQAEGFSTSSSFECQESVGYIDIGDRCWDQMC